MIGTYGSMLLRAKIAGLYFTLINLVTRPVLNAPYSSQYWMSSALKLLVMATIDFIITSITFIIIATTITIKIPTKIMSIVIFVEAKVTITCLQNTQKHRNC